MKKILILILIIFTSLSFSVYAVEKNDCSSYKKLSKEYWGCKKNNLSKGIINSGKNFWKKTTDYQKKSWKKKDK